MFLTTPQFSNYPAYKYNNNNLAFLRRKDNKPTLSSAKYPNQDVERQFADYIDNTPNFSKVMLSMLKGLDENSQNLLKMYIARIYTAAKLGFDFLTPAELKLAKETENLEKISEGLNGKVIEVDGMKFISNKFGKHQITSKLGIEDHFTQKDFDYIKDKCIVDAGAGFGETSILLSKYSNGPVLAFEPTEQTVPILRENIRLNNLENRIKILKYGLSDTDKIARFKMVPDHPTCNTLNLGNNIEAKINNNYSDEIEIPVRSLDSIMKGNHKFGKIGLIKVDIEGEESKFIDGAKKILTHDKPICMLSIYHSPSDFFNLKTKMEELGYKRFEIIKPDSRRTTTEIMLFCYPY